MIGGAPGDKDVEAVHGLSGTVDVEVELSCHHKFLPPGHDCINARGAFRVDLWIGFGATQFGFRLGKGGVDAPVAIFLDRGAVGIASLVTLKFCHFLSVTSSWVSSLFPSSSRLLVMGRSCVAVFVASGGPPILPMQRLPPNWVSAAVHTSPGDSSHQTHIRRGKLTSAEDMRLKEPKERGAALLEM